MKNITMICLAVLLIFSCTKHKADTDRVENQEIIFQSTENNNQHIIEEPEKALTSVNDTDTVFEIPEDIKANLLDYFPDGNYQVLEKPLDVNYRKIMLATHSIKSIIDFKYDELLICDTIIGFEIIESSFQKHLVIKDFRFINGDGSILMDFSEKYPGIFGFAISYSYPQVEGYTPGLVIDTYFDNGKRVADSFTIMWNEDNKKFEQSVWRF